MTTEQTKVVKKYANRKLYDTETSKYTTLKEIAALVASGRQVQVVENVTGADITGQTLMSVIVETESDIESQTETFREIIRAGGLAKYISEHRRAFLPGG